MRRLLLTLMALGAVATAAWAHQPKYAATFQNGVNGFTAWEDSWAVSNLPTRNYGSFATCAAGVQSGNTGYAFLYLPLDASIDYLNAKHSSGEWVPDTVQVILTSSNTSNADTIAFNHILVASVVEGTGSGGAGDLTGVSYDSTGAGTAWAKAGADSTEGAVAALGTNGSLSLMSWPAVLDTTYAYNIAGAADIMPGVQAVLVYGNLVDGTTTTTAFTAFFKDYLAGRITQAPWFRLRKVGTASSNRFQFDSSEGATVADRPKLRVVYHLKNAPAGGGLGGG